jgi:hypothetical protein
MNKKQIRQKFRDEVYKRDNLQCRFCNKQLTEASADAHHITDRDLLAYQGYSIFNGITLCGKCHIDAEQYHLTDGKIWAEGMHPDDLYTIIGSSFDEAYRDCIHKQELDNRLKLRR